MPPTLEQKRSLHAWEAVEELLKVTQDNKKQRDEYKSEARKLPARIINSGLGQALAFIHSKVGEKKPGLRLLEEHLSYWILDKREMLPDNIKKEKDQLLLKVIMDSKSSIYLRRVTDEVMAYIVWLNRFLEAKIEDKEKKNEKTK